MSKLLVLDFDGTMTDAELEGEPFKSGYLEDVATLTGRSMEDVNELATRFEAEVAADPDSHGWIYNGHIVAPASVDPYLRMMPVARKIFDATNAFMNEDDRTRLLDGILYKYNYQKTRVAFRDGAGAVLRALTGSKTFIVTNSHTEPVRQKVQSLDNGAGDLQWLVERVYGRAKKYVIDDDFSTVPNEMRLEGLNRPVLLRRRKYYEVLGELLSSNGLDWSDLVVVGDIFELDLALPLAMGATVGLVVNQFTPEYEKAFVSTHSRGKLLKSLDEIPQLIA